jgi:hypothetical protein
MCHKRLGVEAVKFLEPMGCIWDERFQQDSLRNSANANAVSFETELLGQANSLTTSVLEEFGGIRFRHANSIYQRYILFHLFRRPRWCEITSRNFSFFTLT